jgi:integrase
METKIWKFGLKLITLGAVVKKNLYKTYFRYSCTINGKQVFWHYPTEYLLTKEQVEMVNANQYGGTIQQNLDKIKSNLFQSISMLEAMYKSYPTPQQINELFDKARYYKPMDWYINEYYKQLADIKKSSKKVYVRNINAFKAYYDGNLTKYTLQQIISEKTIIDFGKWLIRHKRAKADAREKKLIETKKLKKPVRKTYGNISIHLNQVTVMKFLNWIAKQKKLPMLEKVLKPVKDNQQYSISKEDFQRLLNHHTDNQYFKVVQDMLYINSFIGLRISELISINKNSITIFPKYLEIRFTEWKTSTPRSVVVVDWNARELIKHHMSITDNKLFNTNKDMFNKRLHLMAQEVFKDEVIILYSAELDKDVQYLKADKVTSHCMRRYAIQRNIALYGVDVSKTFSGHKSYQTIKKYADDFLEKEDVLMKLLPNP